MAVIIIIWKPLEAADEIIYGPFPDVASANRFAFNRLDFAGHWYWLPLTAPPAETDLGPLSPHQA